MEVLLALSAFLILQTLWKYVFRTKQSAPAEPFVPRPWNPTLEQEASLKKWGAQVQRNLDAMAELKRRHKERFPNG